MTDLRTRLLKALEHGSIDKILEMRPGGPYRISSEFRDGINWHYDRVKPFIEGRHKIDLALADVVEALERAGVDMGNAAACNVRFRIQALERIDNALAKLAHAIEEMEK